MTIQNKNTLAAEFQTGDIPDGTNYSNMIESSVNLAETVEQAMAGPLNTTELITSRVSAGNANVTGTLSVGSFALTTLSAASVFADNITVTGTVSASAMTTNTLKGGVTTIACSGTTLATANGLGFNVTTRITSVSAGDTGVRLGANATGLIQYLYNETATSANLWPCTGGQINVLGSGAAFALAGSTLYTIVHTKASGYAVK